MKRTLILLPLAAVGVLFLLAVYARDLDAFLAEWFDV